MLALAAALPAAGISARLWRPYEDALGEARCLHLFGTSPEFLRVVESAQACGIRVVLSPQMWHEEDGSCGNPRTWLEKARAAVSKAGQWMFSQSPKWQRDLYGAVDLLLPNSKSEGQQILRRCKLPAGQIRVVPHGVDPHWCKADPEPFRRYAKLREFVLYVGAIEPRNEQLGFLYAMKKENIPVVILGDVALGCDWYMEECRRAAGASVQFMAREGLAESLLASAFTACRCLVVGNHEPAAERVALCAGISGTPLVLFEGGCGNEYFGHQAVYVQADDVQSIRQGVLAAWERKRDKNLADHVQTYFSWKAIAGILREVYGQVLRPREVVQTTANLPSPQENNAP